MDSPGAVDGEAHHGDGPVMIVWSSAAARGANPRLGRDVVLHEFAHKLDMLDGTIDGTPPIADGASATAGSRSAPPSTRACASGEAGGRCGRTPATNPGEFFAVATEMFFTLPLQLQAAKPALYDVLAGYYRQDPAARVVAGSSG